MVKRLLNVFLVLLLVLSSAIMFIPTEKVNAEVDQEIERFNIFSDECVNWYGRVKKETKNTKTAMTVANSASGFEVKFKGAELKVELYYTAYTPSDQFKAFVRVYIDGDKQGSMFKLTNPGAYFTYTVAKDLDPSIAHTVKVLKATEEDFATFYISNIVADKFYKPNPKPTYKIDVYGDSITAGYGILGDSYMSELDLKDCDGTSTYAGILADKLNAQYNVMAMQGISLRPAILRDDFYMKDAYKRYSVKSTSSWDFSQYVPDLILINIGTNDEPYIIGQDDPDNSLENFVKSYKSMVNNLRKKAPEARIICIYNMMPSSYINEGIDRMVDELYKAGDNNIFTYKAKSMRELDAGSCGHPGLETNRATAEGLYQIAIGDKKTPYVPTDEPSSGCGSVIDATGIMVISLISLGFVFGLKKVKKVK